AVQAIWAGHELGDQQGVVGADGELVETQGADATLGTHLARVRAGALRVGVAAGHRRGQRADGHVQREVTIGVCAVDAAVVVVVHAVRAGGVIALTDTRGIADAVGVEAVDDAVAIVVEAVGAAHGVFTGHIGCAVAHTLALAVVAVSVSVGVVVQDVAAQCHVVLGGRRHRRLTHGDVRVVGAVATQAVDAAVAVVVDAITAERVGVLDADGHCHRVGAVEVGAVREAIAVVVDAITTQRVGVLGHPVGERRTDRTTRLLRTVDVAVAVVVL